MRFIGDSISQAIDWTQDALGTTRPIAETVLFSLLADKKACETVDGYMLLEDDEEDLKRRQSRTRARPRFRFHKARRSNTRRHNSIVQKGDTSLDIADDDDDSEA
jgi:hypothetical protein